MMVGMGEIASICPKCQGKMVQGFVAEFMYGGAEIERWSQGLPKKGWLAGIAPPGISVPIATFRCEVCGYLESYARKDFSPK
jgi:hypothetical protein